MNWVVLISAIISVEHPVSPAAAQAAIRREGAYGPMQIRQVCLTDVNRKYNTNITLQDCKKEVVARWVFVQYIKMYGAHTSYERAARTWNGGPKGPRRKSTEGYWKKVKTRL